MRTITDFFELTFDVLDVGAIMRRVVPGECGATVVLDGYVRQWMHGKETLYLIYEAYEAMALLEMKRLALSAREQFEIAHISIIHRLGRELRAVEVPVSNSVIGPPAVIAVTPDGRYASRKSSLNGNRKPTQNPK